MIICGIELAASEARLAILDGTRATYSHVAAKPPKIVFQDDGNPGEVKAFQANVFAFLRENHIERVAIKKRAKRGEYAGGPVSFKLEGLIQLHRECEVVLVSPQTISAAKRKHTPVPPDTLRKYQRAAFETAFAAID